MTFACLALSEPLLRSLDSAGYLQPTPIQSQAIPHLLDGRDLVGCAQTGTGKTAAYALPTLQHLMTPAAPRTGADRRRQRSGRRAIRALVLAPTRELAAQIGDSLATYGRFTNLRHAVIYGGVRPGPQIRALQSGIDLLVATPGRLLDLMGQGFVDLTTVEILILDEADQMLDMGFIHDLRRIIAHVPERRQTLMFSATMPAEIRALAAEWLRRPCEVHATPVASMPELVTQAVYFVDMHRKAAALSLLIRQTGCSKTLVFSRTRRGADKIARNLERDGIRAVAIHGSKSQSRRAAVMRAFDSSGPPVLVATDLAARGLDFTGVAQVVNYDLPDVPEIYVHRIGRTARAGAAGQAVSLCAPDERQRLRLIEKLTGRTVSVQSLPDALEGGRVCAVGAEPDTRPAGVPDKATGAKPRPPKHRGRRATRRPRATTSGASTASKRRRSRGTRNHQQATPHRAGSR